MYPARLHWRKLKVFICRWLSTRDSFQVRGVGLSPLPPSARGPHQTQSCLCRPCERFPSLNSYVQTVLLCFKGRVSLVFSVPSVYFFHTFPSSSARDAPQREPPPCWERKRLFGYSGSTFDLVTPASRTWLTPPLPPLSQGFTLTSRAVLLGRGCATASFSLSKTLSSFQPSGRTTSVRFPIPSQSYPPPPNRCRLSSG